MFCVRSKKQAENLQYLEYFSSYPRNSQQNNTVSWRVSSKDVQGSTKRKRKKKKKISSLHHVHMSVYLTHTWSYGQMETILTCDCEYWDLTSLRSHGYFWMFSVNKLTPLPAFINSSWWCLWCTLHVYPLGNSSCFHEILSLQKQASLPGESGTLNFGSLCAARVWSFTRQALIFMATFKATMSPFHLGPLGSNESFH